MSRDKIALGDLKANSIDATKVIANSLMITNLKMTGANNVSGATLSYDGVTATPTIKDVVDAIVISNTQTKDEFIAVGSNSFTCSNIIDQTKPFVVFYNGQQMLYGTGNDFSITGGTLIFEFTPVVGTPIYILYTPV